MISVSQEILGRQEASDIVAQMARLATAATMDLLAGQELQEEEVRMEHKVQKVKSAVLGSKGLRAALD